MCGINGIFQFHKRFSQDELHDFVHRMNEKIIHRGPDSQGIYADDRCAIGMRRLSIIDLITGDQPIWNDDNTLAIVFNGEIYNYKDLREELVFDGCVFHTNSDTEVILRGYERHGVAFLDKLDGMFAFCIYDKNSQSLFLARDRAGEKPLYYAKKEGTFLFASELKSIVSTGIIKKNINHLALSQYFQLTYIPSPNTIYEDVRKLNPGHYMTIDIDGNIEIKQYWDLTYSQDTIIEDYDTCKKLLRDAVLSAVERCLVADVPVGAFLSGGIDSTIITGLAAIISDRPINTFTIGFKDKEYDESGRAEIVAKKYNTKHFVSFVTPRDALDVLPTIISNMDEPFADTSLMVTHLVAKLARGYVKTVLTGDAGDELFAGYSRYKIAYYGQIYTSFPTALRNVGKGVLNNLPKGSRLTRKTDKFIRTAELPLRRQRIELMKLGFTDTNVFCKGENIHDVDHIYDYYDHYLSETDEVNRILYTDFKVSLEGDMLTKVDRASMQASLETRVPLLSKGVLETISCIPGKYKINKGKQKIIFKDAFSDIIPDTLVNAPKKGFDVPIGAWLRNELKHDVNRVLDSHRIIEQNLLDPIKVEKIASDHLEKKTDRQMEVWCLYVFEKWWEQNMM